MFKKFLFLSISAAFLVLPFNTLAASKSVTKTNSHNAISIVKQVKVDNGQSRYVVENSASTNDTLAYVLIIKNTSSKTLRKVRIADGLPPYLVYLPGTTKLVNSNTSKTGMQLGDGITTGGITIDDMKPKSTQYVYFKAKIDNIPCHQPGNHRLRNSATVVADGIAQKFNVAHTNVMVNSCPAPKPTITTSTAAPIKQVVASETRVAPVEQAKPLPQSGGELIGILGAGGISYGVWGLKRSRRKLIESLQNIR